MSLVSIKNLRVSFPEETEHEVIRGISFQMEKGEIVGIVGESGSGKSMTSLTLMHLLPEAPADISVLLIWMKVNKL